MENWVADTEQTLVGAGFHARPPVLYPLTDTLSFWGLCPKNLCTITTVKLITLIFLLHQRSFTVFRMTMVVFSAGADACISSLKNCKKINLSVDYLLYKWRHCFAVHWRFAVWGIYDAEYAQMSVKAETDKATSGWIRSCNESTFTSGWIRPV